MFTGAKAMAVQNYLAVKTQRQLLTSEIEREKWEIEHKPDDERKEIEDIYIAKGFSGKELEMIVDKITSDKKVWLDTMLTEELNLNLEIAGSPLKSALRMFVSFLVGGMLPILPFFFLSGLDALFVAIGISVSTSFTVGVIKSRMANTSKLIGGLEMAGLGTGIALIGYGIGSELSNLGIISV
jgi:predicted membrane protein (TIGR00267 family)